MNSLPKEELMQVTIETPDGRLQQPTGIPYARLADSEARELSGIIQQEPIERMELIYGDTDLR